MAADLDYLVVFDEALAHEALHLTLRRWLRGWLYRLVDRPHTSVLKANQY